MATVDLNKDNFEQTVLDNDIVLIDFWASWCGPCRAFAPIYEDVSENHSDVVFGKVNTEAEGELASHFQVRSIPTLMIFRQNIPVFAQPGMLPGEVLEDLIGKVRALDMDDVRAKYEEHAADDH